MGPDLVLAQCSGGNDTVAFIAVLTLGVLYALAVGAVIVRAEDDTEKLLLAILLATSIAIGAIAFLVLGRISEVGNFIERLVVSLMLSSLIALIGAARWREASAGRAVFVAIAGDLFVPCGIFVLFFASLILGTGCLD
jgi:hypothetical protein